MRKLLALLLTCLAVGSLAPTASATPNLPPGCSSILRFEVLDGYGIRAYCEGNYRVVAHCETLIAKWYALGTIATPAHGPSEAVCHGAVLTDYYVEIV